MQSAISPSGTMALCARAIQGRAQRAIFSRLLRGHPSTTSSWREEFFMALPCVSPGPVVRLPACPPANVGRSFGIVGRRMVSTRRDVRVSSTQAHHHSCCAPGFNTLDRARPIITDLHEEAAPARLSAMPCAVPAWVSYVHIAESELLRLEGHDHAFIRINAHDRRVADLYSLEDEPRLVAKRAARAGGRA